MTERRPPPALRLLSLPSLLPPLTLSPLASFTSLTSPTFVAGLLLAGASALLPAQAQVAHDPSAPGTGRPTVLVAPNGVPLVNIQTPSRAGVSRNLYSQFDVDRRGVILNNSRVNTPTVLGGWVQGNPWLASGPATLILNEVNSSNPSQLRGYLEVAGQRAEVVVANPQGILCDGCGFINAGRATLAAASPVWATSGQAGPGGLAGWRSGLGTLQVTGAGLDGAGLDHAALIAQAVKVDAQVRVDGQLQAVAGVLEVALDGEGAVAGFTARDPYARPAVAIDVSRLGGMYAGQIMLVGHGAGVGVRNAGTVGATAGELLLTATGRLENAGTLQAAGALRAQAEGAASNSGKLRAGGPLTLQAQGGLRNEGSIQSLADVRLQAEAGVSNTGALRAGGELSVRSPRDIAQQGIAAAGGDLRLEAGGLLSSSADALTLAGVQVDGSMSRQGRLEASGSTLVLPGRWEAGDALSLRGLLADLSGAVLRGGEVTLQAYTGDLGLAGADLEADRWLGLSAAQAIVTQGARIQTPQLSLNASRLSNQGGTLLLTGADSNSVSLQGDLDNQGGSILAPLGSLWLNAARVDNRSGLLLSGQRLSLQAGTLDNAGGRIHADGFVDARVGDAAGDWRPDGLWHAGAALSLQTPGRMTLGAATLEAPSVQVEADSLVNPVGSSLSAARLALRTHGAQGLDNQGSLEGAQLWIEGARLDNRGLVDGGEVRIAVDALVNRGTGRLYGDRLSIAATELRNQAEDGQAPVIAAREAMQLGVQRLSNSEHALILSAGDLALGGALDGAGQATGQAESVSNSSATLEALGALRLAARQILNQDLHFQVAQVELPSEQVHEYQSADGGPRYAAGTPGVSIYNDESDHLATPEGTAEHWYDYTYTRRTTETRVARADPGRLQSGGDMALDADHIRNDKGQIVAGGRLALRSGSLENVAVTGERRVEDAGLQTEYWRDHHRGRDSTGVASTTYQPAPVVQTIDLPVSEAVGFRPSASGNSVPAAGAAPGSSQPAGNAPPAVPLSIAPIPRSGAAATPVVRSLSAQLQLPNNSLFTLRPEPTSQYLVETDPRFTNGRTWLGSEYLMNALGIRPAENLRRIGDGFYEQRLVREQLTALTGQRRLDGYDDDQAQYRTLMDAGATAALRLRLVPGVALSPEQVAQLSADIVWLVAQEVRLPDGSSTRVLVPQVYVKVREGDLTPSGSLIAARQADIRVSGDVLNGGTIAGRQVLALSAENLRNRGQLDGQAVDLRARLDIDNTGGRISASQRLALDAGRDLKVASTVGEQTGPQGQKVVLDRVAGLYLTGEGGALLAHAGRDIALTGAVLRSEGSASLQADRDLVSDTLQTRSSQSVAWNADNRRSESSSSEVGSSLSAKGDLSLQAGNDIRGRAVRIASEEGATTLRAQRDVVLSEGQSTEQVDSAHQHTSRSFLSKQTVRTALHQDQTTVQGSQVEGRQVLIEAGRDVKGAGAQVAGDQLTALHAGRDVDLGAAQETRSEQSRVDVKRSGVFSSGGFGITLGSQRSTTDQDTRTTTAVKSQVGSLQGSVEIRAGGAFTAGGIDLLAPQGDIDLQARRIEVTEARNTAERRSSTQTRQSGITVALSNPVVSAAQTTQQMARAAGDTDSGRMKALAAATAALALREAAQAVAKDPASAGGVSLGVSVGSSRSVSSSEEKSEQVVASRIQAGGDLRLRAAGGGSDSDILLRGADVHAGGTASLDAEHALRLEAASASSSQHSTERSSSASVGMSLGAKSGVTVAASAGKGKADGEDQAWTPTHIAAGRVAELKSGGDTVLAGAGVSAPQVVGDIGGRLVVESLQDTSRYDSRRSQASANATFGPAPSAGAGLGASKIQSDFASVGEQSALRAGDDGFQVVARGGTVLRGGAITSSAAARDAGVNRLDTPTRELTDIANRADYQASAASVNVGAAYSPEGKTVPGGTSAGIGTDSGHASSVTRAAITGIAGDTSAVTSAAEAGLKPIFDAGKVQKEVDAQVAITGAFGQRGAKAWGEYATDRFADALKSGDEDAQACWAPTGACRSVGHALIGAATGGSAGAVGAVGAAQMAPRLGDALRSAGVKEDLAKLLVDLGVAAGGLAVGGRQAGAAALNEADNNTGLFGRLLARAALTGGPVAARACRANPSCWSTVVGMGATTAAVLSQIADMNQPVGAPGFAAGDQPLPNRGTALPDPGSDRNTSTSTPIAEDLSGDSRTRGRESIESPPLDSILGRPATERPVSSIVQSSSGSGKNPAGKSPFAPVEVEQRLDALGPLPALIDRESAKHILFGDGPDSGGHAYPGQPGKTPFPAGWRDLKILDAVFDIATNPSTPWRRSSDGRYELSEQMREGVEIRVVLNPISRRIVSAYPVNLPRNPK